jgi:hypothetical protein
VTGIYHKGDGQESFFCDVLSKSIEIIHVETMQEETYLQ